MSSDGLHKSLLQIIGLGVATVQPDSLEILFENSRFFAWFKPKGDDLELLQERVAGLNVAELRSRLNQGRAFSLATEVRQGARSLSLVVDIRPETIDGQRLLHCRGPRRQQAEGGRVHARLLLEAGREA